MQVDIGIISVRKAYEPSLIKLYCVAFVLSNSRYKYGVWFERPLTSADFVNAIEACFEYMEDAPMNLYSIRISFLLSVRTTEILSTLMSLNDSGKVWALKSGSAGQPIQKAKAE